MNKFTWLSIAALFSLSASAQVNIRPAQELNRTIDSAIMAHLLRDLNIFLRAKEEKYSDNKYIMNGYLPETAALLDEMKAIEQNKEISDTSFYKPYLTNLVRLDSNKFMIGISYMGVLETLPKLRASFKLIAGNDNGTFRFYAPLKEYTAGWKILHLDHYNFFYRDTVNLGALLQYYNTLTGYDQKIGGVKYETDFYCCSSFDEALRITGIDYKSDYSGYAKNTLSSREQGQYLVINGVFTPEFKFDPHDLFHERLRLALNRDSINRPVDEGCAYLYGGSWGLSWADILQQFRNYAAAYPAADWLKLYIEKKNFKEGNAPLNIAYAINALLVQKLEQEKGFPAVRQLISCGKQQQGDANYFAALEKNMGITKEQFNEVVGALINKQN